MEAFNVGSVFKGCVKTLYKNISSVIINNGDTSDWFNPMRGVRQGCPISPYLFIMAVELLAIGIRETPKMKGIKINDSILKITQLPDDTTCFVPDILCAGLLCAELCAGLKINTDKTKANYIGSLKGRVEDPLGLEWTEENIHCLYIVLSGNEDDHYELNYKKNIELKNILNSWKGRKLSLKGKITIINNLALPPLLYVASVIHTTDIVFKEVKAIIHDFECDGKPSRIAYEVLIQSVGNGGLKLMDIETKVNSLKAVWVK